jgi:hypothetical protein
VPRTTAKITFGSCATNHGGGDLSFFFIKKKEDLKIPYFEE